MPVNLIDFFFFPEVGLGLQKMRFNSLLLVGEQTLFIKTLRDNRFKVLAAHWRQSRTLTNVGNNLLC